VVLISVLFPDGSIYIYIYRWCGAAGVTAEWGLPNVTRTQKQMLPDDDVFTSKHVGAVG
jgi:hypothetical protein